MKRKSEKVKHGEVGRTDKVIKYRLTLDINERRIHEKRVSGDKLFLGRQNNNTEINRARNSLSADKTGSKKWGRFIEKRFSRREANFSSSSCSHEERRTSTEPV